MVLIAIFVSRFEATMIASMLRGYDIYATVDGEAHASVEYISLALGGHRLRVCEEDYWVASEILREAGVLEDTYSIPGPSRALLKFLTLVVAMNAAAVVSSIMYAGASLAMLLYVPLSVFTVPIDPKGRPDYYLAEPLATKT